MRPIDADVFEKFIRENCADSLVDLWCELVRRQPTIEAVPVDRKGIINEFATKAIERLEDMGCEAWRRDIMAIAEEMKGGAE